MRTLFLLLCVVLLAGCGQSGDGEHFVQVIGGPGHSAGFFHRPRGLTWSAELDALYVVDWDGRIQRFSRAGQVQISWMMPEVDKGKPEGICLTPEGHLLVADTHYSRVIEFDAVGREVRRWGSYGTETGQFIYPVAICMDARNRIYVAEYGENDRVQVFDRTGHYLHSIGEFGDDAGQLQRPSGLAIGPEGAVYVADAVNHRLQVFTPDGTLLRIMGGQGQEPGHFYYPYDLSIRGEDLYVVEYGGQRVQKLRLTGEPLAMFGTGGAGDGQFAGPWKLCAVPHGVYVSDTNNSRVVLIDL